MNTLKYKGFIGSVNFSEADGVFFGKIEGIDGLVNFQGASIQEITRSFHKAVDDYVAFCKKQGLDMHCPLLGRKEALIINDGLHLQRQPPLNPARGRQNPANP